MIPGFLRCALLLISAGSATALVVEDGACVYCALKLVFANYLYSETSVLPPDALRSAMSRLYAKDDRFQMGATDDASEAMESILKRLHFEQLVCGGLPPSPEGGIRCASGGASGGAVRDPADQTCAGCEAVVSGETICVNVRQRGVSACTLSSVTRDVLVPHFVGEVGVLVPHFFGGNFMVPHFLVPHFCFGPPLFRISFSWSPTFAVLF